MRSDYRSINDRAHVIDLELQLLEYSEPHSAVRPVCEPVINSLPRPKALRQVTPRNTGFRAIEDRVDE